MILWSNLVWQLNWLLVLVTIFVYLDLRTNLASDFVLYNKLPGHCKIKGWTENNMASYALTEKILSNLAVLF